MPKFRVTVKEVHNQDYLVNAETAEEAKALVNSLEQPEGAVFLDEGSFEYNYTLEPDTWTVKKEA